MKKYIIYISNNWLLLWKNRAINDCTCSSHNSVQLKLFDVTSFNATNFWVAIFLLISRGYYKIMKENNNRVLKQRTGIKLILRKVKIAYLAWWQNQYNEFFQRNLQQSIAHGCLSEDKAGIHLLSMCLLFQEKRHESFFKFKNFSRTGKSWDVPVSIYFPCDRCMGTSGY